MVRLSIFSRVEAGGVTILNLGEQGFNLELNHSIYLGFRSADPAGAHQATFRRPLKEGRPPEQKNLVRNSYATSCMRRGYTRSIPT
jgi:hypothetical protein